MADSIGPLFDLPPAPSAPKPTEQQVQLARVSVDLKPVILEFLRARLKGPPEGRTFHLSSLTEFVSKRCMCSPESPGRVFRALKRDGRSCQVRLLSRSQSLYEVTAVAEE